MSSSVAAIALGEDYQAMVFWKYATMMLKQGSEIESIGYEYDELKSFDDVVVSYKRPQNFRKSVVEKDYIQVKYHVTQSKLITIDALMDPEFVNASKYSFIDKVFNAYKEDPENFCKSRFILYTPWDIDQTDSLYSIVDNNDHSIKLSVLFDGTKTDGSAMGKIRKKFKDKMQIDGQSISDDILYKILSQVCIYSGSESIKNLKEILNREFSYNGLKMWPDSKITNPYIDMIHAWMKVGKKIINAEDIMDQCRIENLIAPKEIEEMLAIRSFIPNTEGLKYTTEKMCDLTSYFEGRKLKDGYTWGDIRREIEELKCKIQNINSENRVNYYIELVVHLSIAFMVGRSMNPKSGICVMPMQRTQQGSCRWDSMGETGSEGDEFLVETKILEESARDTVLMISITNDIENDVKFYLKKNHMEIYKFYHCKLPKMGINSIKDGAHAWKLAEQIHRLINKRDRKEKQGILHVFIASPTAFMFNLGKMSQNFGRVQLYEFDLLGSRDYTPSVTYPMEGEI